MTFSGHLAVATLTLSLTKDPLILVPLNVALHFVTDMIPHVEWPQKRGLKPLSSILVLCDTGLTALIPIAVLASQVVSAPVAVAALVASLVPDLGNSLLRTKCRPLWILHEQTHCYPQKASPSIQWERTVTGKTPTVIKIGLQVTLVALSLGTLWLQR